ncbi:aminoacyl-tRNA hydrolase [Streptomyces sp. BE20]|uniref:aminoacyl-tRNA hydrolase n=1 Tax=Streptomyces sp. BE20 TaxID=3002525 RepID=UPI002E792419|nr:aminoacyl-tRNA hydrolase [Streptomyces sp. BE20]MEE1824627.1 aminoacyl-tRNA hydrolase [Streptomyces sp. BE20]
MTSPFDAPVPDPTPEDRDARPQYVLPLVVRLERTAPPGRTDALETSARAVLTLLSDRRVTEPDGEWTELVEAWEDARIRKVVRRARGGEWNRAGELPGITVAGREAEVRVFPPVPLDGWPKELAKLQVSGTELEESGPVDAPAPGVPVLWLNPEVEMSAGKTMAQTGHAAQLAWWRLDDAQRKEWAESGFALAVRTAGPEAWGELVASGLPLVQDAGFTEIAPGSSTVVADHPALRG